MEFRIITPSGFLKDYVKYYCIMESSANEGNIRERVIPVENIQLMFHYREPFRVYHGDGSISTQPSSLVGGLNQHYFDAETHGAAGVIFVSFHPVGACCFFDFPLNKLNNLSVDLASVWSGRIQQVEDQLRNETSEAGRIQVIEQFLSQRFVPVSSTNYRLVRQAVSLIKQNRGQIPAFDLAGQLAVTNKTLERKFTEYVGLTPKQFSRLIRFQNILVNIHTSNSLTECSVDLGYFDQSHFIRDFKQFSGFTPGEYASRVADPGNISIEFAP